MNIPEIKHKINTHIQNPGTKLWIILAILVISNIASFELGKSYSTNNYKNRDDSAFIKSEADNDYSLADPEIANNNSLKEGTLAAAVALSNENSANNREVANTDPNSPISPNLRYVASTNGRVYYFTWCSGAKRIQENNRQYFASANDARLKGLTPSKSCPGLD